MADPIVRFQQLISQRRLALLEERQPLKAWDLSQETFSSQILGPHFEELARAWVREQATGDTRFGVLGPVGSTVVNDQSARSRHEVDVIALADGEPPQRPDARIALIGEAKSTNRHRTRADLQRLEGIRTVLGEHGARVEDTKLVLFSRAGFAGDLEAEAGVRRDVVLVSLAEMYRPI